MDRARGEFLAGAALAGDQHRGIGLARLAQHVTETQHRRAAADDAVFVQGLEGRFRGLEQLPLAPGMAERDREPLAVDRQGMEVVDAGEKVAMLGARPPESRVGQRDPLQRALPAHELEQPVVAGALKLHQTGMEGMALKPLREVLKSRRAVHAPARRVEKSMNLAMYAVVYQRDDVPLNRSHCSSSRNDGAQRTAHRPRPRCGPCRDSP